MNDDNAILESIDLVRIHLTSLVVTATVAPRDANLDEANACTSAILSDLHTAMLRVKGNRSPQSCMGWADLRLLLAGYLHVYLAHLEKEP